MQSVREQLIQSAIAEVHQGARQKDAAARHSIPTSTLADRLRGAASKKEAKIPHQRLSPEQESFRPGWCLNEERAVRAPSRRHVVAFAQEILAEGGDYQPLGARWIDRFLRRNIDV
jgi:4-hydroxybenzoate polyprenyltransferase